MDRLRVREPAVKSAAERLYIELAKPFDRYERCALDSRIAGWRGAVSYKPCRYNRVAHAHNHQHAARIVRRVVGHCGSASRWHRLDRADRKIVKCGGWAKWRLHQTEQTLLLEQTCIDVGNRPRRTAITSRARPDPLTNYVWFMTHRSTSRKDSIEHLKFGFLLRQTSSLHLWFQCSFA